MKSEFPERLLYVHNSADIYGASRSLLRLMSRLRQEGLHPLVILPENGPLETRLGALGVEVIIDRGLTVITRTVFRSWRVVGLIVTFPLSVWRLYRLMRRRRIQLVHSNTGVIVSPALAARLARVPHVWHIRDSFADFRRLWKPYAAYMQCLSSRIIAVSRPIAAQFPPHPKVLVIHNGVDLDEFSIDSTALGAEFRRRHGLAADAVVIGCVGRIKFRRKGQENLVLAAARLKQRGFRAKYLLVGGSAPGAEDHPDRLRRLIRDQGVEADFVLTGEVSDPRPAYAAMDIFVLPSAQPEPFGGVILEAMGMGLPVIGTAIGGTSDQVEDGRTGFLIPPADPDALADKLEWLRAHPDQCQAMGRAGRDRLKECFSFEGMYSNFSKVYREVTNETSHRPV